MIRQRLALWVLFVFVVLEGALSACTLWSASGTSVAGGGTITSKNRDMIPGYQTIEVIKPKTGFRYVALMARDERGKEGYPCAATNQYGFTVVTATASSIPSAKRKAMPTNPVLFSKLMESCKTVNDALAHRDWFRGPRFLLMSDRQETAVVEIGPDKKISVERNSNGTLIHTNFYVSKDLMAANDKIGESSTKRYQRINELLRLAKRPLDVKQFQTFSRDAIAGPDNSLFRTGKSERTLASWIVRTPAEGSPILYVKLWDKNAPERSYELNLDDVISGKAPIAEVVP